jgi:hypothetical protein
MYQRFAGFFNRKPACRIMAPYDGSLTIAG